MRRSRTSQKAMIPAQAPVSQPCEPLRQIFCHECGTFSKEPCFQHIKRVPDKVVPYAVASLPDTLYLDFPTETTTGKGVFARETIPSLTLFGPLVGTVQKHMPKPMRYACRYVEDDTLRYFQLSSDETSNWMKFVRFAESSEEQNVCVYEVRKIGGPPLISAANSYLQNTCWRVVFVTTREILADEELKVGYSLDYAKTLGYQGLEDGSDIREPKRRKTKRPRPTASPTFAERLSLIERSDHNPMLEERLHVLPRDDDSDDILYDAVTGIPAESATMANFAGLMLAEGDVVVLHTEDSAQLKEIMFPEECFLGVQADQGNAEAAEKLDFNEISGGDVVDAEPAQSTSTDQSPTTKPKSKKPTPDSAKKGQRRRGGYAERIERLKSDQPYYSTHGTVVNFLPNVDNPMGAAILATSVMPASPVPAKPKRAMRTPGNIPGHKLCLLCWKTQSMYGHHMREHHPEWVEENWTTQCPKCPKRWASKRALHKHIFKVHGTTTAALDSGADPLVKQSHMDYISRTGRYTCVCDKCGVIYPTVALLDLHIVHCNASSPPDPPGLLYACPAGDFTAPTFTDLVAHIHHHEIPKDSPSPCLICGINLYPGSLLRHAQQRHPEEMKIMFAFGCDQCEKRLSSQMQLNSHKVMHNKRKKGSQCMYCAKQFSTPLLLALHVVEHQVAERFPCQYCVKTYDTYKQLRTHFTNFHDVTKSRVCGLCGKVCKNHGQLTIHRSTHSLEERGMKKHAPHSVVYRPPKTKAVCRKKRKPAEEE